MLAKNGEKMKPASMVEILACHQKNNPDSLFAVDSAGGRYTYGEAWAKVKDIADYLTNHLNIGKEDKIMVECGQNVEFLLIDMACELAGAVFVPIEDNASYDRKLSIYQETESKLWISYGRELEFIRSISYQEVMAHYASAGYMPELPASDAVAEILYTTGTTGKSKGIVITNGANVALAENIRCGVQMRPENVEFIPIPISHSHGIRCCYANLLNGGTIVLADGLLNVKRVFIMLDEYAVTAIDLSPSAVQLLIKVSKGKFWDYGRKLDYIQIGTAALPESLKEELVQQLPGVHLYNFYGSTESGRSCVLDFSCEQGKKNCIGKPTVNAEIIFTDDERNRIKATAEFPGLLASNGSMNMREYYANPELTAEIMRDGFVFTNDLGYMDEDGYVYILGRKGDVINYNGIKISPEEIEEVAVKFTGVKDCACVPMPDKMAGQVPRLVISTESENDFDTKTFARYLADHLDGNKVPKKIDIVDEIPRTSNGKIRRKDLI